MGENLERKLIITPRNVENGDFLLGKDRKRKIFLAPIISNYIYGKGILTAKIGNKTITSTYADAIVLKRDGTYLIGEDIQKQLAQLEKQKEKGWKGVFERVHYSSGPGGNIFVYG